MSESTRSGAEHVHPFARTREEWERFFEARGERRFRGRQVFRWLHVRHVWDPALMTDLSQPLRESLQQEGVATPFEVSAVRRSADGTRKLLCQLSDGNVVECVVIPMTRDAEQVDADLGSVGDDDAAEDDPEEQQPSTRVTLCVSTQVGCAMGCVFCASGQAGLKRGLTAGEIVAQVFAAKQLLEPNERLRNLVFMGMGEPLHHYEQTARAIRVITDPDGLAISPRRITVSTVGLVPGIERLGRDFGGKVGLAISLHAPEDGLRSEIIPMNRRYPLEDLVAALRRYPLPRRRRITLEYTLIASVNDRPEHARQLARLFRGIPVKVNLIPVNPIDAVSFSPPSEAQLHRFRDVLAHERVSCSVRKRRGDDVDAACGQLALVEAERLVRKTEA